MMTAREIAISRPCATATRLPGGGGDGEGGGGDGGGGDGGGGGGEGDEADGSHAKPTRQLAYDASQPSDSARYGDAAARASTARASTSHSMSSLWNIGTPLPGQSWPDICAGQFESAELMLWVSQNSPTGVESLHAGQLAPFLAHSPVEGLYVHVDGLDPGGHVKQVLKLHNEATASGAHSSMQTAALRIRPGANDRDRTKRKVFFGGGGGTVSGSGGGT